MEMVSKYTVPGAHVVDIIPWCSWRFLHSEDHLIVTFFSAPSPCVAPMEYDTRNWKTWPGFDLVDDQPSLRTRQA